MKRDFDDWALFHSAYYEPGSRVYQEYRLSRMLVLSSRRWVTLIDDAVRHATGCTRTTWQTLFAIAFSGDRVTTLNLADRVGIQWPSLVRTLNALESDGLITRTENPEDKRSRWIQMTDRGRQTLKEVQPVLDSVRSKVLNGLSDKEVLQLTTLLSRVYDGVDDATR